MSRASITPLVYNNGQSNYDNDDDDDNEEDEEEEDVIDEDDDSDEDDTSEGEEPWTGGPRVQRDPLLTSTDTPINRRAVAACQSELGWVDKGESATLEVNGEVTALLGALQTPRRSRRARSPPSRRGRRSTACRLVEDDDDDEGEVQEEDDDDDDDDDDTTSVPKQSFSTNDMGTSLFGGQLGGAVNPLAQAWSMSSENAPAPTPTPGNGSRGADGSPMDIGIRRSDNNSSGSSSDSSDVQEDRRRRRQRTSERDRRTRRDERRRHRRRRAFDEATVGVPRERRSSRSAASSATRYSSTGFAMDRIDEEALADSDDSEVEHIAALVRRSLLSRRMAARGDYGVPASDVTRTVVPMMHPSDQQRQLRRLMRRDDEVMRAGRCPLCPYMVTSSGEEPQAIVRDILEIYDRTLDVDPFSSGSATLFAELAGRWNRHVRGFIESNVDISEDMFTEPHIMKFHLEECYRASDNSNRQIFAALQQLIRELGGQGLYQAVYEDGIQVAMRVDPHAWRIYREAIEQRNKLIASETAKRALLRKNQLAGGSGDAAVRRLTFEASSSSRDDHGGGGGDSGLQSAAATSRGGTARQRRDIRSRKLNEGGEALARERLTGQRK